MAHAEKCPICGGKGKLVKTLACKEAEMAGRIEFVFSPDSIDCYACGDASAWNKLRREYQCKLAQGI